MKFWQILATLGVFLVSQQAVVEAEANDETLARDSIRSNENLRSKEISDLRLRLQLSPTPNLQTFVFEQFIDQRPVENGRIRLTLLKPADKPATILKTVDHLARSPLKAQPQILTKETAENFVRRQPEFQGLDLLQEPQSVYLTESEEIPHLEEPRRVWKFRLASPNLANPISLSVFIDDETSEILLKRSEIYYHRHFGSVLSNALPDLRPYQDANLLVERPLSDIFVKVDQTGSTTFSDRNGRFEFTEIPSRFADIWAQLTSPLFQVNDASTNSIPIILTMSRSDQENRIHMNPDRTELQTSNTEAYRNVIHVNQFVRLFAPTFPGLDQPLLVRTNIASQCNAFFSQGSLNFYRSGSNCPSTAYSTIVAHEYGHHLVQSLLLPQGAFGEGFADSIALLAYHTDVIGEDFYWNGTDLRSPRLDQVTYPCGLGIHRCGEVLGGFWSELRALWIERYPEKLKAFIRFFFAWAQLTEGGIAGQAAHPETAREVLLLDGQSLDFRRGTPHGVIICRAMMKFGIPCPTLGGLKLITYDPPEISRPPNLPIRISAKLERTLIDQPVEAILHFRYSEAETFQSRPMTLRGRDLSVELPASPCGTELQYFIEASSGESFRTTLPVNAPQEFLRIWVADAFRVVGDYPFHSEAQSWRAQSSNASNGWNLMATLMGDPIGPLEGADSSGYFWVTTNGYELWFLGETDLTSPEFLGFPHRQYRLNFQYFARHRFPDDQDFEVLQINQGQLQSLMELTDTSLLWRPASLNLNSSSFDVSGDAFQLRFRASSASNHSIFRGALDSFKLREISCSGPICASDLNGNGEYDPDDLTRFLNFYHQGSLIADFNRDGILSASDLSLFFQGYYGVCH